jgi:L-seryl-tRNA(Ser) seleniumtransferase
MDETQLRSLPAVERVLAALRHGGPAAPHAIAVAAVRGVLDRLRVEVRAGVPAPAFESVVEQARAAVELAARPSLRPVINASGVILQTNLGRAPLGERAIAAMEAVARGYSNLEFDLDAGERGSRHDHVRDLIRRTTGAEDGIVVNNNAAALLMVLQVFARDRDVIVSRGQAVEIGGGFRIPDVLLQSGARLVEVGTTNRTYARDYAAAITPETAAILRVHTSNFRVVGFTAEASTPDLAAICRERGILLLDDLGSGCLVDTARFGLVHEPTVQESLAAGSDLTMFSGDKLLGGPQCGIIAGKAALVETLRRHPLARALRVDRLTIAALNATLLSYVEGREAEDLPIWRMLGLDEKGLKRRASRWARAAGEAGSVVRDRSMVGGGSLPGEGVATWCVAIRPPGGSERFAASLRSGDPPVVARIADDAVLLDPRTVAPADDAVVAGAIASALVVEAS